MNGRNRYMQIHTKSQIWRFDLLIRMAALKDKEKRKNINNVDKKH
jgi:hypothetical protein